LGAVLGELTGAWTARHKQHVRAGDVGEGRVDAQMYEIVVVVDHSPVFGADDHLRAGQIREDLVGPIASRAVNPWYRPSAMIMKVPPRTAGW
jgi:hypothetical protein